MPSLIPFAAVIYEKKRMESYKLMDTDEEDGGKVLTMLHVDLTWEKIKKIVDKHLGKMWYYNEPNSTTKIG